jgi:hypothetical protein
VKAANTAKGEGQEENSRWSELLALSTPDRSPPGKTHLQTEAMCAMCVRVLKHWVLDVVALLV